MHPTDPDQPYQPQPPYQPPAGQPVWPPVARTDSATPPAWTGGTTYGAPQPRPPRRRRWLIPAIAGGLVVVAAGVVLIIRGTGAAPAGTPLVGEDSGVAACKAIAEDNKLSGDNDDDKLTEAEYRQIRKQFADSHDAKIRDNGTKIIDIVWQVQGMGDDAGLAALPLMGDLMSAYTGLAGGCADHGITIPPLNADGT